MGMFPVSVASAFVSRPGKERVLSLSRLYTLEPAQARAGTAHVWCSFSTWRPSRSRAAATVTMRLALLAGVTGGDPTREVALSIHSNLHRLGLALHTLVHVQRLASITAPGGGHGDHETRAP